ncbi:MAG: M23 family metallopeptidase [Oscillospiraceae bacterium]|nr:M23 family metallopeptidase [Oscillospiraceae bacterium]
MYFNLNSGVTVQAGQHISSGDEIGAVGETADIETSDGSHLHFEVLKNGSYVDPISMM